MEESVFSVLVGQPLQKASPTPEKPYHCGRYAEGQMARRMAQRVKCVSGSHSEESLTEHISFGPNISIFHVCS